MMTPQIGNYELRPLSTIDVYPDTLTISKDEDDRDNSSSTVG